MGIGICTGAVMVDTIGSIVRAKYGVVGTAVNLASPIEQFTVGAETLVAESTIQTVEKRLCVVTKYQLEPKGSYGILCVFSIAGIGGDHVLKLTLMHARVAGLTINITVNPCLNKGKYFDEKVFQVRDTHAIDRAPWLCLQEECLELTANSVLRFPENEEDVYAKIHSISICTAGIHLLVLRDRPRPRWPQ